MVPQDVPSFAVQLELSTTQENRRELVQTLVSFRQRALDSGGVCEVLESLSRPNAFLWLQCWRSEEQLEEELRSVGFLSLLGAIEVLGELENASVVERHGCRTLDNVTEGLTEAPIGSNAQ
jgi:hypothetical protein